MVGINDINPFGNFDIGAGAIGNALILFVIVILVFGMIGWLIYWRITSRQFRFKIPLYKSINGINYKQATYSAKNVPISLAGDSLWFVRGIKKFIAPATKSSALNEFPHEERDDGEWINFEIATVNEAQKKAGVQFIHQDMRTQRVATGQILEQRLINKSFWEKYKDLVVHLLFYLIVTMLMIVTFWQWGDIVERIASLISQLQSVAEILNQLECVGARETGIIPAFILLMFRRKK